MTASFFRFPLTSAVIALVVGAPCVAFAQPAPPPGSATANFTDSAEAGLAGTRRVAITSVVITFQASTAGTKAGGSGLFANKLSAESILAMPNMDQSLQDDIAEAAYDQLKAKLSAAGFEVVPESEVKASTGYQQIVRLAGLPNHTQFGNALGDAELVSPAALVPYLPYLMEAGQFESPKSYIGWTSKMGGSSRTSGGPSVTSIQAIWKLPSLEVALAKELNAHVVKANYVVTLGKATAGRGSAFLARSVRGDGTALAEVGLLEDQTRISFRTPTGNAKWQKVAYTKPVPPKDGDVVVRLTTPLAGSSDFFRITSSSSRGGLFNPGADFQFLFTANLTDAARYQTEVNAMISDASQAMTSLLHP